MGAEGRTLSDAWRMARPPWRAPLKGQLLDLALAGLSGGLLVLAFPSFDLWPLAFVVLVPWLARIPGQSPRTAGLGGLVAGMVFFLGSLWWVAGTMVRYGALPVPLALPVAVAVLAALTLYLSLYVAAFSALLAWIRPTSGPAFVLAAAGLWVALEYLRTHLLSGFPWNLLGYSQYQNFAFLPAVTVTGVYGLSFFVMATNAALAWALRHRGRWAETGRAVGVAAALAILALVPGGWTPAARPTPAVPVTIIQGNIAQDRKWDPARQEETLWTYRRLTQAAAVEGQPALVVWPETAVPFPFQADPRREAVLDVARAVRVPLLVGAPHVDGATGRVFNSAFLIDPAGGVADRYDKVHLVPFGEYVPLRRVFFFADWFVAGGIGEFAPGATLTLFESPAGRFGVTICYEAIFPDLVRRSFAAGADFLVNITNDAWFGRTSAPYQHLAMATVRAVENGAYVVRAANTGISAIIAPDGRILRASGLFTQEALGGLVEPRRGTTFYTRYGDVFAAGTLLVTFLGVVGVGLTRAGSAGPPRDRSGVPGRLHHDEV